MHLSREEIEALAEVMRISGRSMAAALVLNRTPTGILQFRHATGDTWYEVITRNRVQANGYSEVTGVSKTHRRRAKLRV